MTDLIDWEQLESFVSPTPEPEMAAELQEMWAEMLTSFREQLDQLEEGAPEAGVRAAMHQLRGRVAFWGLRAVAGALAAWELDPVPQVEVAARRTQVLELAERSAAAVIQTLPWLAGPDQKGN